MLREMLQGKLHRAVVTDCHIDYPGSLTVDIELIERSGMLVHQKVQVLNINNGYRLGPTSSPGSAASARSSSTAPPPGMPARAIASSSRPMPC